MILATWNMQGSKHSTEEKWQKGVLNILAHSMRPDAICLQEAGAVPESAKLRVTLQFFDPAGNANAVTVWEWGGLMSSSRGSAKTIVHHRWDTGANRVNTAVVTRLAVGHPASVNLAWGLAGPVWRPAVGVMVSGQWIYSFHAISPGGADAVNVIDRVDAMTPGGVKWRVGGDFNRDPATLPAALLPANSVVCPPNTNTHPTKRPTAKYDYFVCRGLTAQTGVVNSTMNLSDHRAVSFAF